MGTSLQPRRTILVVDDEPAIREALRELLEELYAVTEAACGIDAIRLVHEIGPDLVLLDLMMPGLDGLAVLERLRSEAPETNVVLLTAVDSARAAVNAMKLGALDYLTKPIDEDALHETLRWTLAPAVQAVRFDAPPVLVASDHAGWRASLAVLLQEQVGAVVTSSSHAHVPAPLPFALAIIDVIDPSRAERAANAELRCPPSQTVVWAGEEYCAAPRGVGAARVFRNRKSVGDLIRYATQCLRPAGVPELRLSSTTVKALHVVAHAYGTTTVENVASIVGLSSRHLSRVFRDDAGITLKTYLLRVRVEAAKTLLRESPAKVQTIAEQVGLCNASYMARIFRQFEGDNPRGYRDRASTV